MTRTERGHRRLCAATLGFCLLLAPAFASAAPTDQASTPAQKVPARKPPVRPPAEPVISIHGLVDFGYQAFVAKDSFDAVLGKTGGPVFGGGLRISHRSGIFGQVTASRFTADGERVFVFDGEVFPLGIPVDVEVTPIDFSIGYRYIRRPKAARTPPTAPRPGLPPSPPGAIKAPPKPRTPPPPPARAAAVPPARRQVIIPFVGGGFGKFGYKESADFAEPGDDVDESFTSYHVMGGVDVAVAKWIGVGVEAKYRWVPDGLGENGVSQEFEETDLGGFVIVGRVTIGR